MRFPLDQGTPRSAAARLRDAGHDAIHTAEIGFASGHWLMEEAPDKVIPLLVKFLN